MDKAKQSLESEYNELQIELKTQTQGKGESEQRRKKAESLVQDLQVKHGESERQRQELADRVAKMQVRGSSGATMGFFFFCLFCLMEAQFLNHLLFFQSELDSVNSLLTEAEGKNIKSSQDASSLESQLQDSQVCNVFKSSSSSFTLLHFTPRTSYVFRSPKMNTPHVSLNMATWSENP